MARIDNRPAPVRRGASTKLHVRRNRAKKHKICHSYQRMRCSGTRTSTPRCFHWLGCHTSRRTRQTSQPGSGDSLDGFSACENNQKRSEPEIHRTYRKLRCASCHNYSQELRLFRLSTPPGRPRHQPRGMTTRIQSCVGKAMSHDPERVCLARRSHKKRIIQQGERQLLGIYANGIMYHKLFQDWL